MLYRHTSTSVYTSEHVVVEHQSREHSKAKHRTAQNSTAQHSTAQHSTAQHSTAQSPLHKAAKSTGLSEYVSKEVCTCICTCVHAASWRFSWSMELLAFASRLFAPNMWDHRPLRVAPCVTYRICAAASCCAALQAKYNKR